MPKIYIMNGPDKGRSFEVDEEVVFVGRAPDNEIPVKDKSVSRKHQGQRNSIDHVCASDQQVQGHGVLYVDSIKKPHGFRKEDLDLLTALSSPAALAIENSVLSSKYREGMS